MATAYRFRFDLDNSVTRSKRSILKFCFSRNSKVFVWNTNFFPRQAVAKISLFVHSTYTGDTPYQVCFVLNNSLNRGKKPIFKILYQNFFFLCSTYTVATAYWVWFGFDNSLSRWKRPIFKIRYSRNSKISVWNTNLFPRQAIAKIPFFLRSTKRILNTLVRFRQLFDPIKNIFFSKFVISEIRKLPYENLNFPMQAIPKIPFFLCSTYTVATAYRFRFDLDNSLTRSKRTILKFRFSRNSKFFVWNTNLFPRQAIAKIPFFLHSTQGILNTLVRFRQLFDPMKKIFFQNSLFAKLAIFHMKT